MRTTSLRGCTQESFAFKSFYRLTESEGRENMIVCLCSATSDRDIRKAVEEGVTQVDTLRQRWGVAAGCGTCRDYAQSVIDAALAERAATQSVAA
jgi:bacterioferritin-associated ferredoxin